MAATTPLAESPNSNLGSSTSSGLTRGLPRGSPHRPLRGSLSNLESAARLIFEAQGDAANASAQVSCLREALMKVCVVVVRGGGRGAALRAMQALELPLRAPGGVRCRGCRSLGHAAVLGSVRGGVLNRGRAVNAPRRVLQTSRYAAPGWER